LLFADKPRRIAAAPIRAGFVLLTSQGSQHETRAGRGRQRRLNHAAATGAIPRQSLWLFRRDFPPIRATGDSCRFRPRCAPKFPPREAASKPPLRKHQGYECLVNLDSRAAPR
jgi:hypothetical protein